MVEEHTVAPPARYFCTLRVILKPGTTIPCDPPLGRGRADVNAPVLVLNQHKVGISRAAWSPLQLAFDGVQGPTLHLALDPPQVLADEREHEALDPEHEDHGCAEQQRAGEVRLADPVRDRVDA